MTKTIFVLIAFVVMLVLGFILRNDDYPYNIILNTIHKLLGVGISVYTIVLFYQYYKEFEISNLQLIFLFLFIISAVLMIASGGLISANKFSNTMKTLHLIANFSFSGSFIYIIYFLLKSIA